MHDVIDKLDYVDFETLSMIFGLKVHCYYCYYYVKYIYP